MDTTGFLLDTNFLLVPGRFKVDIFSGFSEFGKPQLLTLDLVVEELMDLKDRNSRLALEFIREKNIEIIKTDGKNTDKEIEKAAETKKLVVCTLDKKLIKNLKKKHIPVITLRQKRYLVKI